ncbi:hypothetical protein CPB97_010988 [Podila verticillata]|nr:hypothetical protein CPB97_010988 [Podila verticillata]
MSIEVLSNIPLYEQRNIPPPRTATLPASTVRTSLINSPSINSASFLPRSALSHSPDHATNFQQLLFFRECFQKNEFWDECAILDRMHYKNKSQHRAAGYFQRLAECRRLVTRIKELDISGLTDELVRKFYSGKSLKTLTSVKGTWDSIPYRSTVAFTMTRIIGMIRLLRKLQSALHETYGAFYQLMSKTQFMSFALIAIGFCSRLSLISKAWTNELADAYILLGTWMKTFPKETLTSGDIDYEQQLPSSIGIFFTETIPDLPADLPDVALKIEERTQTGGIDLGEVISRTERPTTPTTKVDVPAIHKPSKAISEKATFSSEDEEEMSSKDSHKRELDAIFGMAPSPKESASTPAKRKKTEGFDLDSLFGDSKKQRIKSKKSTGSTDVSRGSSPASGKVVEKPNKTTVEAGRATVGAASNFDDIFKHDEAKPVSPQVKKPMSSKLGSSGKDKKKEIDDIFGGIVKKKKKKLVSEIDSIFGLPKKKMK